MFSRTTVVPVQVAPARPFHLSAWLAKHVIAPLIKLISKKAFRYRYPLRPLWFAIILQLGVPAFSMTCQNNGINPVAAGMMVIVIGLIGAAHSINKMELRDQEQMYAAALICSVAMWAMSALVFGPFSKPIVASLWVGMLALGGPWWRHRRIRKGTTTVHSLEAQWVEKVAHDKGALPGSSLDNIETTKDGKRTSADIELNVDADQYASKTICLIEPISARLRIGMQDIGIERHPTGHSHLARLTLFHGGNPLQQVRKWEPCGIVDGKVQVGMYADHGPLNWLYWNEQGVKHGLVCGGTGAGKSILLSLKLAAERKSNGLVVSWAADGQTGQSLPEWTDSVDRFAAGVEESVAMLEDAYQIMQARSQRLAAMKRRSFTPSLEMPTLAITVDEASPVLAVKAGKEAAIRIAQMGRKCGVSLTIATQHPDLSQMGNSEVLRSQLRTGNVVVFRATTTQGAIATGGLCPDPSKLPEFWPDGSITAGICYSVGRGIMARSFYIDEDTATEIANTGKPWPLNESPKPGEIEAGEIETAGPKASPAPASPLFPPKPTTNKDQVLRCITEADKPLRRGDIILATGVHPSTVRDALAALRADGSIIATPTDNAKSFLYEAAKAEVSA